MLWQDEKITIVSKAVDKWITTPTVCCSPICSCFLQNGHSLVSIYQWNVQVSFGLLIFIICSNIKNTFLTSSFAIGGTEMVGLFKTLPTTLPSLLPCLLCHVNRPLAVGCEHSVDSDDEWKMTWQSRLRSDYKTSYFKLYNRARMWLRKSYLFWKVKDKLDVGHTAEKKGHFSKRHWA